MATISDVAKLADVSVATVSRVLNNESVVREKTRRRVLLAVKALDYSPNLIGRSLRSGETKKVLVLLPDIANSFYSTVIRGISSEARLHGYQIFTAMTRSQREEEERYLDVLRSRIVDGLIMLSSTMPADSVNRLAQEYPVVQCSEYVIDSHTSGVSIDNERAAYEAASYLISLGHENIGFIGSNKQYRSGAEREAGFLRSMREHGLEARHLYYSDYSLQNGYDICLEMLKKAPPTAIFAISDWLAVGAMNALYDRGTDRKISVMGFDDSSIARAYRPQLSSVTIPRFEMGRLSTQLLIEKMIDPASPPRLRYVKHKLTIRDTTHPVGERNRCIPLEKESDKI